jgi:hypothetical protein
MEKKAKSTAPDRQKIKIRSHSSPVPRLSYNNMSLEKLEKPAMDTPGKRPSPNTDKELEKYAKKNELPISPRLSSLTATKSDSKLATLKATELAFTLEEKK